MLRKSRQPRQRRQSQRQTTTQHSIYVAMQFTRDLIWFKHVSSILMAVDGPSVFISKSRHACEKVYAWTYSMVNNWSWI